MDEKNNIENKKQLVGEVIDSPMEKTTIVKVERRFPHPVYKKFIRKSKCFCTHECFNIVNILFNPKFYPKIIKTSKLIK